MSRRAFREAPRPVVLLLGWLGSKAQNLSKYQKMYQVRQLPGGVAVEVLPVGGAASGRRCQMKAAPPAAAVVAAVVQQRRQRAAASAAAATATFSSSGAPMCVAPHHHAISEQHSGILCPRTLPPAAHRTWARK